MGILNVTPDSFSDGGRFHGVDQAVRHAEEMISEGVDIIDIGGESTRPGSLPVDSATECSRILTVVEELANRFDTPISVDTTKAEVALAAINAGAEIINDISGLRWDKELPAAAAKSGAAVVLMHSRGEFATLHSQPPVEDIMAEVVTGIVNSLTLAREAGIEQGHIALDVGIGFGKTKEQNLELVAKLAKIVNIFEAYPIAIGTSRKSFIGKLLGDAPVDERLGGSLATAMIALQNGARILRVHDVQETVAAVKLYSAVSQVK